MTRAAHPQAGIPFGRLLRVESEKAIDTRAARWLLGITALLVIASVGIPLALPNDFAQTPSGYAYVTSFGVLGLMPAVGILLLTSEWSRGTILVTFTQEPRRLRVLAAKGLPGIGLGVMGAVLGFAVTMAGVLTADVVMGREVSYGVDSAFTGLLAASVLNMVMATAFAALLQNSATAIIVFYVVPSIWGVISIGVLAEVGAYLDTSQAFQWILEGETAGHWPAMLVSISLWVVLPLIAGAWRVAKRDVRS
jgi:hypothetical protein